MWCRGACVQGSLNAEVFGLHGHAESLPSSSVSPWVPKVNGILTRPQVQVESSDCLDVVRLHALGLWDPVQDFMGGPTCTVVLC